jgi:hypothetical protein
MSRWRVFVSAFLIIVAILVGLIVYFAYTVVNDAVALDDCHRALDGSHHLNDEQKKHIELLHSMLLRSGRALSRDEWVKFIQQEYKPPHVVVIDDHQVSIDNVTLRFDGQQLVQVIPYP